MGGGTGPTDVGTGLASYGTTPGGTQVFGPTGFTETGGASGFSPLALIGQGLQAFGSGGGGGTQVPQYPTPQVPQGGVAPVASGLPATGGIGQPIQGSQQQGGGINILQALQALLAG